jgi:chromosome segregation ATPase
MAASTKMRAESIAAEVVAEDKRHEAAMQEMRSKLEAAEKQLAEKKARDVALQKEIEIKKTQLHDAWKRCVQYQQEEGHELSQEPTDDGPAPSLDVDKLKASLENERAALLVETAERDRLKESLSASHEELSDLVSKEAAAREEAESIRKTTEVAQDVERERREANNKFLEELEKERRSVSDLRRSVSELEESIGSERKRLDDRYSEQAATIKRRQAELEVSRVDLAVAVTTIQELEGEFEKDEKDNARLVKAAKQDADSARSTFEVARQEVEALEASSDTDIQKEVEDIQQAQSILVEDTKDEIAQLCEGKCGTSYRLN